VRAVLGVSALMCCSHFRHCLL